MKNIILKFFFLSVFILGVSPTDSLAKKIRIGSLQYGSVNWELKLIQDLDLDKKNSFELEIVELASKNAAAVALQGGAVDLITNFDQYLKVDNLVPEVVVGVTTISAGISTSDTTHGLNSRLPLVIFVNTLSVFLLFFWSSVIHLLKSFINHFDKGWVTLVRTVVSRVLHHFF